MNWQTKAIGQRLFSSLPGGDGLYYLLQKKFGGYRNFNVESKVSQSLRILEALNEVSISLERKNTCEIGTGWIPIMPMVFYLFGQESCHTLDVQRLLKPQLTQEAARQISLLSGFFEQKAAWAWNLSMAERLRVLEENSQDIAQLFNQINLTYKAPVRAPYSDLAAGSIDVLFSNTTFEHIPQPEIVELLLDAKRTLAPNGSMVHLIDCSDHFSHSDPTISQINFLQFSESEWQKYNSKFLYQNRLRASAYSKMIEDAGFKIRLWKPRINQSAKTDLLNLSLSDEFSHFDVDDICTTSVVVIATL